MNHAMVKAQGPKGIGLKSQLNSIDTLSSQDARNGNLLMKPKDDAVKGKKFSLVPFAKDKSQYSSSKNSQQSISERNNGVKPESDEPITPMAQIQEVPVTDEGVNNITGKDLQIGFKEPSDKDEDDDEDDYEDDNDFEPFETSKKDFYQGDSVEENSAEAKS